MAKTGRVEGAAAADRTARAGVLYGIGAYMLWGLLPVYWKAIDGVPAREILCHRMAWSLLFTTALLLPGGRWRRVVRAARRPRVFLLFLLTASLITLNWFVYIWAVTSSRMVEASLGYFINPLVHVFLGVFFLRERLRPAQWTAIGIAAAGVAWLAAMRGGLPWISLILAFSFGLYGLLRKTAPLDSLEGLSIETALVFPPALAYLLLLERAGAGAFGHAGARIDLLLALSGTATALPLLWFAHAARRVRLSTIGVLHYIAPTLQFLLGVLAYGEPFDRVRLIGFLAVWAALAVYTADALRTRPESTVGFS